MTRMSLPKGLFTLTAAVATETQLFFSRMGYIGLHGSVHMETCGNSNPRGPIQPILSIAVAAVSVNES